MNKSVLAYLIVDNSMLKEAKRRIEDDGHSIVDIHASRYEELANNPIIGVPLAGYNSRYSTIIFEKMLTDDEVDSLLDITLAMLD